jgi:predicted protein tyrosine phosphatase
LGPLNLAIEVTDLNTVRSLDLPQYSGVITIEEPDTDDPFRTDVVPQLVLQFHDIDMTMLGYVEPEPEHVQQALTFARETDGPLLVHCRAGVSRSTAIALAIAADRLGTGNERQACEWLRQTYPQSQPNRLVVFHADLVLKRDYSLSSAAKEVFNPLY